MPERIVAYIEPEDFGAFRKLMPNDERLGKTYNEWTQRRAEEARLSGETGRVVTVTPEEFEMYCLQLGQAPNYSVLDALAVRKVRAAT